MENICVPVLRTIAGGTDIRFLLHHLHGSPIAILFKILMWVLRIQTDRT